jgi:DNA-binding transcriptional ArsR family regulator
MDPLDLLLHPVRLRIVHVMAGYDARTTSDLCERLPDVPKTTLYRHVGILAEAGVLEVVDEQRVHGAVERHYRLRRERTLIDNAVAEAMSLDDHRRAFAGAMASLLAEFNNYLDRGGADPAADLVGYRQGILWLTHDELAETAGALRDILAARWTNQPAPGRRPHLVSVIGFPIEAPKIGAPKTND